MHVRGYLTGWMGAVKVLLKTFLPVSDTDVQALKKLKYHDNAWALPALH